MDKQIYELHAEVCQSLGNATRIEIVDTLRDGEMSAGELASKMGIAKANLAQHLAILKQRGIVTARREGVYIYYRIANPKVVKACDLMREVLFEQLAESEKLMKDMQAL